MPDLTNCKKDKNGNLWCYDRDNRSIFMVKLEKPIITKVPQEILFELLKAESEIASQAQE